MAADDRPVAANISGGYPNVAPGKHAEQSSASPWSHPEGAAGAIKGHATGGWGFHTSFEENPWWLLDLGAVHVLHRVRVFNRSDETMIRARTLAIHLATERAGPWQLLYAGINVFGGLTLGTPLLVCPDGFARARFLKLWLREPGFFHLDEVEVYGEPAEA